MAFFKRMLSSIGIGAAKVDTVLEKDEFVPGETVEAVVKITGGSTEQEISGLYFSIHSSYQGLIEVEVESDEEEEGFMAEEPEVEEEEVTRTALLGEFKVADEFTIGPEEEREIPLSFELPLHTPLTMGKTKVWIRTGLDIQRGKDAGDRDYIQVVPGELMQALFEALSERGFELMSADCEEVGKHGSDSLPFVQEFEFKAFSGPFHGRLDELELVCFPDGEDCLEVFMDVDRKVRNLGSLIAELLDADETRIKFDFCQDDLESLPDRLHELIDNHC